MRNEATQCYKRASSHHRMLPSYLPHSMIPQNLNKDLNSSIPSLVVYARISGKSSGFLDLPAGGEGGTGGKSRTSRAARREQSTRAAEQMRTALEGERKRGMDAEDGRGNEREG